MIDKSMGRVLFRYFEIVTFLLSISLFVISHLTKNNDMLFVSLGVLLIGNMLYGIEKMKERFIFCLFNFACLFFLYGRTFIKFTTLEDWQYPFSDEIHSTAITIIYISVLFLLFGAVFYGQFKTSPKPIKTIKKENFWQTKEFIKNLQIISFIVYLFCAVFLLIVEIEKPIAMRGKSYVDFYYSFESSLPGFVLSISALAKFALCMFLATLPPKRMAFTALGIYVVSTIPVFIVGQRNQFISAALFVVCYYLLRDYIGKDKPKKWFGKFEGTAIAIALPFFFAFLSVYESIRKNIPVSKVNIFSSISDLFYSQGVTYEVICKCIKYIDVLPETNINYTFGAIIAYFKSNGISKMLFGTESYSAQTLEMALYGNSLSDTVSYLDLGQSYFQGAGLGSSYIVEAFVDFGYIGVALFSFILGISLVWFVKVFNKNILGSYLVLVALIQLFMVPRSSATGWLVLLIYIPAIILLVGLWAISYLCQKKYYKDKKG